VFEKNPNTIKNFGMWIRYDSRSGTHNMYKEYRDCTVNGAVEKMCTSSSVIASSLLSLSSADSLPSRDSTTPDIRSIIIHPCLFA
jgi:large subunit ribosomal protein L18Ae